MSTDLIAAAADYDAAEHGGAHPANVVLASARRFAQRIAAFDAAGDAGLAGIAAALQGGDDRVRHVAARILSALRHERAAALLIAAFVRGGPYLDPGHLRRLGKVHALPPSAFPALDDVPPHARGDLAMAILRHPTPRSRALVDDILTRRQPFPVSYIVEPLARWGERATLRALLDRPPDKLAKGVSRMLALDDDVPARAALHLVLAGEPAALDRLEAMTRDARHAHAGPAIECLGLVAHPRAVAPTSRLLRARKLDTVASALDAARALATPLLGESLAALVEPRRGAASLSTTSVSDDAAATLAELVGFEPAGHLTGSRALIAYRTALIELDPRRRYLAGKPLTLVELARDLASSHAGPRAQAAWGLRAITGEDHGYDVDDDVTANLAAIDAWLARARDAAPVDDGHWAFGGARVEPPTAT